MFQRRDNIPYKIVLIGCGVVGQGFLKILRDKEDILRKQYDFEAKVVAIFDKIKGSVIDEEGIDLEAFITHLKTVGSISSFSADDNVGEPDLMEMIRRSAADIMVEVTNTNIDTGEPAVTYIREALKAKQHVVTTNKGPVALFFKELEDLAKNNNVHFRFEGTVMSGTPLFNLIDSCLSCNEIVEVKGIFNGTTNFILTKMEEGMSYEEALILAQISGCAEADSSADVEGFDTLAKTLILANVVLGGDTTINEVDRMGITDITSEKIKIAKAKGKRYKHIGHAKRIGEEVVASIEVKPLTLGDPLATVKGSNNIIILKFERMPDLIIQGPGAGQIETGYSVLNDILTIHEHRRMSE